MPSLDLTPSALARERANILKSGRLHWFHWMVVIGSLGLTLTAWYFTKWQMEEKTKVQFDRAARHLIELVSERMQKYEEGLWGGVAAIQAQDGKMSLAQWRVFATALSIDTRYPGINGIGVIQNVRREDLGQYLREQQRLRTNFGIHPDHGNPDLLPITFIEPEAPNASAIGLDIAHETNRYEAALKARDTGTAQITGPITLVQDKEKTPGFLFYAPFYANSNNKIISNRKNNFSGMVYAPFVFNKLIEGALAENKRSVKLRIKDGDTILYDEHNENGKYNDPNPMFNDEFSLNHYGRTWKFDIWTTPTFRAENFSDQPNVILVGGFVIDGLLLTLFVLLTRANRRAIQFVDATTGELKKRTLALEQTNEELEVDSMLKCNAIKQT